MSVADRARFALLMLRAFRKSDWSDWLEERRGPARFLGRTLGAPKAVRAAHPAQVPAPLFISQRRLAGSTLDRGTDTPLPKKVAAFPA
jgi:hypothetical protein